MTEFRDEILVRPVPVIRAGKTDVPVLSNLHRPVAPPQRVPRQQPLHATEQRGGPRGSVICEVVRQRFVVQHRWRCPCREQRFDLRRKVDGAVLRQDVVQRLDPQPIPGEEQLLRTAVPDREREHSAELFDGPRPLLLVEPKDALGIAAGAVTMAPPLQRRSQILMVVDLAVIDDVERPGVVVHRLMPAGNVDD